MWYEIFKFEIQYRAKRPDTYLFFVVLFLCSLVAFNFIYEGQNIGMVKENAPYIIAKTMTIFSGIFMLIISMIMGVPILRDFEYKMESLLFVNPVKKRDYLLGRFLGSFVVLVFIFSGLIWGIILGEAMPWRDASNLLPFNFWAYLKPFLTLVLPTLFFGGSIFFVSGTLSRNLMVVYTQGVLFFVVYILSNNIAHPTLSAILEPFSFRAVSEVVKLWSVDERNSLSIPITDVLLYNRIFWMLVGVLALMIGYYAFNFNVVKDSSVKSRQKQRQAADEDISAAIQIPHSTRQEGTLANFLQLKGHALFYFQSIFKSVSFWSIILCGAAIIFINSISLGTSFGVDSYPTTYLIVENLQETSIFFFLIILVFYSGELIWHERGIKINEIQDALPLSDFINLAGKFIGLILIYFILLSALIISGIIFQTFHGYYHYEIGVYFAGFFLEIFPFLLLYTFLSFFLQVLSNSKYIGHLLVLLFFLATMALSVLDYGHPLFRFGSISLGVYSDMNGYGHFLKPYLLFQSYWLFFCLFLFITTVIFTIRGTETHFKKRWKLSRQRLTKPLIKGGLVTLFFFILTGSYIFYNTNILNTYWPRSEKIALRADYEKTLKAFEFFLQPQIAAINLKAELYPSRRDYSIEGYYVLTNKHLEAIHKINVQKWIDPQIVLEFVDFEGGATLDNTYEKYSYYTYTLHQALQPGDSIKMAFRQTFTSKGFNISSSNTRMVHNGTSLGNQYFPTLGYNESFELRDQGNRKTHGLAARKGMIKKDDQAAVLNGYRVDDYEVDFEMVVGTDSSQIAIAPGKLKGTWTVDDRQYFHYKMEQPMLNLYAIVSARYEVLQDVWMPTNDSLSTPVALEIYYHKGHEYNLNRMMESMKTSFDYFSTHFSPYQYQQMRIMEFPRYATFAQSFANTIPFSEALGFVLDIDDQKDVDIAGYVTAHEVSHQWWGHQIKVAEVQGWHMIIESLAQYSALMVLKEQYPAEKVQQFLQTELEAYWTGRLADTQPEMPLDLVEGQEYIYYRKGGINLYALQDYISEDRVNLALRRFIQDWNSSDGKLQKDRYPTSTDLLHYFRTVTPDSLQYVITDLFETITWYDNKTREATYTKHTENQYKVNLNIEATKYRADRLGTESIIHTNDWIDIGVYAVGQDGKEALIYLEKHKISDALTPIEIVVNRPPSKAGIDPLHKLIDKQVEDNVILVLKE